MTNIAKQLITKFATVISRIKFLTKLNFVKKILSTLGIAVVATNAVTTSANAAAVTLLNAGAISTDGNYVYADINANNDTLTNSAAASIVIDGVNASMTFATLITAADLALTINMVDTNDIGINVIDSTGIITATAGSTLIINVGNLVADANKNIVYDIGGALTRAGTGTIAINIAALDEVNVTAAAILDATIIGTVTSILDIDGASTFAQAVVSGVTQIDAASVFSSSLEALGATNIDSNISVAGNLTLSGATQTSEVITFTGTTLTSTAALVADAADAGLTINGTGDKAVNMQISPDANAEFNLIQTAASGTVTFTGVLGVDDSTDLLLKAADFQANSKTILNNKIHSTIVTVGGELTLRDDQNVVPNIALASTGKVLIDDTIVDGETIFKIGASFTDGSIAGTDNIELPSNLDDGETMILIGGVVNNNTVNAAIVVDAQLAIKDTAFKNYVVTGDTTAETVTITANDNSTGTIATNLSVNNENAAAVLQAYKATKTEAAMVDIFTNTLNERGDTTASLTALANQVAPQEDSSSGTSASSKAVTGKVQGIISNRMASLRSGDAFIKGASAGNMMSANSGFIQAFGSEAEQKNTKLSNVTKFGYDSDTTGIAIGFDGMTEGGSVIGLSFSASETDVIGKGTGKSKASTDAYTASLYVDKSTDAGYVEGSITVGHNENTNSRLINSAGVSRSFKGAFDSSQVSVKIGGGVPTELNGGTYLTPFGSLTGTQISHDKYTETGSTAADTLRLTVEQDDVVSVIGSVGLKAHKVTDYGTPMISLQVNSELGDDTISATNTYKGGGTAFKTKSEVEDISATLGIGYTYGSDLVSLDIGYEAEANDDEYLSHYGSVRIVSKF